MSLAYSSRFLRRDHHQTCDETRAAKLISPASTAASVDQATVSRDTLAPGVSIRAGRWTGFGLDSDFQAQAASPLPRLPPMTLSDASLDELARRALAEEEKDAAGEDTAWEAINELRRRGSQDVFERARSLVNSTVALERKLGFDVLGQLGLERPFREETVAILRTVLAAESDAEVIAATLIAFGHLRDERGRPHLLALAADEAPEIRRSVAWALPSCAVRDEDGKLVDQEALTALIVLMEDDDEDVRDWATFAVGQLFDDDTPEVRAALARRLSEPHEDTREEAICGLARRHDERAIAPLIELLKGLPGSGALDAAEEMADPRLIEGLEIALQKGRDHLARIESALACCRRSATSG